MVALTRCISSSSRASQFIFGLALSMAFYPWFEGAATSPRWAIAVISLYFVRWWCLPFIGFAFWKLGINDGAHWAIICGALCWGYKSTEDDVLQVLRGAALGMGLNGALAIAQYFGFTLVPQAISPAGLFVNRDILSESAALIFVLAFYYCEWGLCLIALPPLLLGASRASWLAVFVSILPYLSKRQAALWGGAVLILGVAMFIAADGNLASLNQRMFLWRLAIDGLTPFGSGPFDFSVLLYREPHVHNDFLQLIYSFGLVGLIPILVSAWCFIEHPESRPFILCFGVISFFGFPLEMPFTAWLGTFALGHYLGQPIVERGIPEWSRMANA